MKTVEELVGSCLVFGIPGKTITPEIVQHFKETHCRGLILYRINFESPDQLRKLISDLESALGRRLLVCTDHEGGRVIMFQDGVTIFPSAQAFGKTGNPQYAHHQGTQEGRELRRLGIDVNFAPVLDVLTEAYSPNIGIRAFGADPELVAKMGAARIAAMQVEGLSACAKHFPGLGPATLDPHLHLPTIAATWEDLERIHMVPFRRAMRTAVHSIMTSHPLYPNLDPTPNTPATFSRKIVHDYLRQTVGYKGVVFSDDLEMGAITEICPIGEAAVRTMAAGHDSVLVCHSLKAQREVFDALVTAYKSNRLPLKELEASVRRIDNLESYRLDRFAPLPGSETRAQKERDDVRTVVQELCQRSVTTLQAGPDLAPGRSTQIVFPRLSALAEKIMIEPALLDEQTLLRTQFEKLNPQITLVGVEPAAAEIEQAVASASQADQTVLYVFDAHIYSGWRELLEKLGDSPKTLVVILLRDAYDIEFVRPGRLCLTNFGFRLCDLEAIRTKLAL